MENNINKDAFLLKRFEVEKEYFGEDKGKYKSKITFQNGKFESFVIEINQELSNEILSIIKGQLIIKSSLLIQSLNSCIDSIK